MLKASLKTPRARPLPGASDLRGLTLLEVVIALALVGVLVMTFAVSLHAAVAARRIKHRSIAAALADEQLSVLRTFDPASVAARTNGALHGVLYQQGTWQVAEVAGAPSGTKGLRGSGPGTGVTAVLPFPKNAYGDLSVSSTFKVEAGSPANWRSGFLFRASDLENGYRAYLTATSLVLERVSGGIVTTLHSDIRSIAADTWQTLEVVAAGPSIELRLNGATAATVSDDAFASGKAALFAREGASVVHDDIALAGDAWDFEGEAAGDVPSGWERFGLSDLPGNATSTLTVSSLYGDDGFKRYSVTVRWFDSVWRSLTQTTDVSR